MLRGCALVSSFRARVFLTGGGSAMQLDGLSGTVPGRCLDNSLLLTCQRLHGSTGAVALRRPGGVPSLTTIELRYRVPRVKFRHHLKHLCIF